MSTLKTKFVVFICFACLLVGILIGWLYQKSGAKSGEFTWKQGDNELTLKLDQEQINEETLLKQMFSEEWTRSASTSWLKQNHGIFYFKDVELADSISRLVPDKDQDKKISENLQELSRKKLGPWQYKVSEIEIGYPNNPPATGRAYGCENGNYYREKVKLRTLNGKNEVIVEVTGKYACPTNFSYPDLQISKADKEELFKNTPFGKTEKVMALIIND